MSDRQEGWLHAALSNILLIVTIGTVGAVGLAAWNVNGAVSDAKGLFKTIQEEADNVSAGLRLVTVDEGYINDLKALVFGCNMQDSKQIRDCLSQLEVFVKQNAGHVFVDKGKNDKFWSVVNTIRDRNFVDENELYFWLHTLACSVQTTSEHHKGTFVEDLRYTVWQAGHAAGQADALVGQVNRLVEKLPGLVEEQVGKLGGRIDSKIGDEIAYLNGNIDSLVGDGSHLAKTLEALAYRVPGILYDIEHLANAASNGVAMCMGESEEIDVPFAEDVYNSISKVKKFADDYDGELSEDDKLLLCQVSGDATTLRALRRGCKSNEGICIWKTDKEELRQFVALVGKDTGGILSEEQFIDAVKFLHGDCKNFIRGVIFKVGENKVIPLAKIAADLKNSSVITVALNAARGQYSPK